MNELTEKPQNTPADERLFDEAAMILPQYLKDTADLREKRLLLMRHLASDLLDRRIQNHTPEVNLLTKLFDGFTWQQVCEFGTSNVPYKDGLAFEEGMVAFNKLMLCLLGKATATAADAAHAASMLETVQALVRLWLRTNDLGVASQASTLLLDLLRIDRVTNPGADGVPRGGQGLVWKRIFGDRDVYNIFYDTCSLAGPSSKEMSKAQKTIAQSRLLEWLPKVGAMDWAAIARPRHVDVERRYGVQNGLLEFAALRMVDYNDDVLMHRCLIDFFSSLLSSTRPMDTHTMRQHDSVGLQFLIMHGLHTRTAANYLQLPGSRLDLVDATFTYGPAANYVATYAANYPDHYLASQMPAQVNQRLTTALTLTASKWAHQESPKHDLHLIASLPRKALLPFASSPLALIPSRATNPDALNTLATVFHGPEREPTSYPLTSSTNNDEVGLAEGAAARTLYYHYLANNPRFWNDIATHSDTVALKDLALAAINCLTSVITANWATSPDMALPSSIAVQESGHLAILSPPALEYALPYLLKPPQTFSNLVGGRGDAESAAYKIASAKFDALRALEGRLRVQVVEQPGQGYEEILATIGKRLAEGPMSREGEVGGLIGTLEM